MTSGRKRLLFVYNADAGFFNMLTDHAHKILSPGTYPCNLCKITFEGFSMKREWKEYLSSLDAETVFLHKDEFRAAYPALKETPLPAVFMLINEGWRVVIMAAELNGVRDVAELGALLKSRTSL